MHSQFLNLPHELIVQVLWELPPSSIVKCQLVNRQLDTLIRDSVVLQYAIALDSAVAEDNPCSVLPINSKVKQLKSSQKSWETLCPAFVTSQAVAHQSDVYDLSAGVYVLSGDLSRTSLYSSDLPSRKDDEIKWKGIGSDKVIIDIGLCLFEHDLIALVTASPHEVPPGTQPSFDIEIDLREFSTDKPHPLAESSTLYIMNSQLEKPTVGIEIVGPHLALVLSFPTASRPSDRIFIFEWKKNTLKASLEANHGNYANLLFLSEDLILLPNNKSGTLDVFRIPAVSTLEALTPLVRLSLPALSQGLKYGTISCRAEPNPISRSSIPEMRRRASASKSDHRQCGWTPIAADALCLFRLSIWIARLVMTQDDDWTVDIRGIHRLSFVVHRSALLQVVSAFESAKVECKAPERGEGSEGTQRENGVPEPDEVPSAQFLGSDAPITSTHQTISPIDTIPWHGWGLYKTRWFNMDEFSGQWITTTAGQRLVRMRKIREMGADDEAPFEVLDFNPQPNQKAAQWLDSQLQNGILPQLARVGEGLECFAVLSRDEISQLGTDEYGRGGTIEFSGDNHGTDDENNSIDEAEEDENTLSSVQALHEDDDDLLSSTALVPENSNPISPPIQTEPATSTSDDIDETDEDHEDRDESNNWPRPGPVLDWSAAPPGAVLWAPGGEAFEPAHVFAESLINGLSFVERVSRGRYRYDGVMLDEKRVIGTRLNFETRCLEEIEVHHFG